MAPSPAALRSQIPLPYTLFLLTIEPLLALNGAVLAHFLPTKYLLTMSPHATPGAYAPLTQVVFDQLAATYVLFAFNEAVTLRVTAELRVWKSVVGGILICDLIHLYGSYAAMGSELFLSPSQWRMEEWVNIALLVGPGAMRVAFLLELGYKVQKTGKGKKEV